MEIKVECENCGDELDVICERTDRGTIWVSIEPHSCDGEVYDDEV